MDFRLSPELEKLGEETQKFAEEEVSPRIKEMEEIEKIPKDLLDRLGELGYTAVLIPEAYAAEARAREKSSIIHCYNV